MAKNVTIQKIIAILLHRIKFILISGVIVGLLFFIYSNYFITPKYSTSTMIFIQNYNRSSSKNATPDSQAQSSDSSANSSGQSSNNDTAGKIFYSDINGSSALAKISVTLFKNSDEITRLYNGCGVHIYVEEGTFYITINVTGSNPEKCANVANQIADECNKVFYNYFGYGQIGTIRKAGVPGAPYSPDKTKNTIIGFLIGLVVACLISILLELIDTTIKPDEDLADIYKIPVFAEIPDFESQSR